MNLQHYLFVLLSFFLLSGCSSPARLSVHEQLRQHLLEAEYGSAISIHFAKKPGTPLPPATGENELLKQLSSPFAELRWSAAEKLAYSQNKDVVYKLVDAMLDPSGTRRICVMASALGLLKDPRALSPLTEAAFNPTNRDLRLCAIRALGMIEDRRAVPSLIKALKQRNMPVQAAASLARLGDERALNTLITAANDLSIRRWMLASIGELGSKMALAYLEHQLTISSDSEKAIIRESIWKIQQLSTPVTDKQLAEVLHTDKSISHKKWAAYRLGNIQSTIAIEALIEAMNKDFPSSVKGRAAAALIRIGDNAIKPVRQILNNDQIDEYLLAAAGYILKPTDSDRLRLLSNSKNQTVRNTIKESINLIQRHYHLSSKQKKHY